MSVLVKGMEMPKSCITCPLCECRNECAYCEVGDKYLSWDWDERLRSSRNDHCPLTEVQQHGDLVERDKIWLNNFEIVMCNGDYKEALQMQINKILDAPTVIEREEET